MTINNFYAAGAGPTWLELERICPWAEAERLTCLSRDTIERNFPKFVARPSPRRTGIKLKHVLAIVNGSLDGETAASTASASAQT
jgi:hypothetical protein